jgi:3-hydroxybutyryl-CoA dehydrogenase
VKAAEARNVAVIGAGLMGPGIALTFARGGFNVRLHDLTADKVQRALDRIRADLALFVENGLASASDVEDTVGRIQGTTDLADALHEAHYVVEAVFEDLAVKQQLFREFERLCPAPTVLASNTSALSVDDIACTARCPERVIAANYWNPPHILPLVEVVPGRRTSTDTVEFTCEILRRSGKRPVVLQKYVPGYIGNRLQFALLREAVSLVERGIASAEDVDAVVEQSFGRRLAVTGPLKTADLGGLDVFLSISRTLFQDLNNSSEAARLLLEAVQQGHLGAKTGKGIYDWPPERIQEVKAARDRELMRWLKVTLS